MNAREMIAQGGVQITYVGIQRRPVIEWGGRIYEKAIHFDDGLDHSEMLAVSQQRAVELRELVAVDTQNERIIDIATYLLSCAPGLSPQMAEEIAQGALDAAEVAARENRPTLSSKPDPGKYWAERLGEQE